MLYLLLGGMAVAILLNWVLVKDIQRRMDDIDNELFNLMQDGIHLVVHPNEQSLYKWHVDQFFEEDEQ